MTTTTSYTVSTCGRSHYGSSMDVKWMAKWGKRMGRHVAKLIDSGVYPILVYRGMSGISAANAIAYRLAEKYGKDFGMVYVRKPEEKSHGAAVEYTSISPYQKPVVWIFCDDFVSTGVSLLETLKGASKKFGVIPLDRVLYALTLGEMRQKAAFTLHSSLLTAISNSRAVEVSDRVNAEYNKFVKAMKRREKQRAKAEAKLMEDIMSGWLRVDR